MFKEDEPHIIDYILDKTDPNKRSLQVIVSKRQSKTSITSNKEMRYCGVCQCVWNGVPNWIDVSLVRVYPKGAIPRFGKKKEMCPRCQK